MTRHPTRKFPASVSIEYHRTCARADVAGCAGEVESPPPAMAALLRIMLTLTCWSVAGAKRNSQRVYIIRATDA